MGFPKVKEDFPFLSTSIGIVITVPPAQQHYTINLIMSAIRTWRSVSHDITPDLSGSTKSCMLSKKVSSLFFWKLVEGEPVGAEQVLGREGFGAT